MGGWWKQKPSRLAIRSCQSGCPPSAKHTAPYFWALEAGTRQNTKINTTIQTEFLVMRDSTCGQNNNLEPHYTAAEPVGQALGYSLPNASLFTT